MPQGGPQVGISLWISFPLVISVYCVGFVQGAPSKDPQVGSTFLATYTDVDFASGVLESSAVLASNDLDAGMACSGRCQRRDDCLAFSLTMSNDSGQANCKLSSNRKSATSTSKGTKVFLKYLENGLRVSWYCHMDEQCAGYPDMTCVNGACACKAGLLIINDGFACYKQGNILAGNRCNISEDCAGFPLMACDMNRVCSCPKNFIPSASRSACVPNNLTESSSCEINEQCSGYPDMTCQSGVCKCNPGYWIVNNNLYSCYKQGNVLQGSNCNVSEDCVAFPSMTCVGQVCSCPSDKVTATDRARCLPGNQPEGSGCEITEQCAGKPDMTCQSGTCRCNAGYYIVNNNYNSCYKGGTVLHYGMCNYDVDCSGYPRMWCPPGSEPQCYCTGSYAVTADNSKCVPLVGRACDAAESPPCIPDALCNSGTCSCPDGQFALFGNRGPCFSSSYPGINQVEMSGGSYNIEMGSNFPTNAEIFWCVKFNVGKRAEFRLSSFNLPQASYIAIWDGCSWNNKRFVDSLIGFGLGTTPGSTVATSASNEILVRFSSGSDGSGTGFTGAVYVI